MEDTLTICHDCALSLANDEPHPDQVAFSLGVMSVGRDIVVSGEADVSLYEQLTGKCDLCEHSLGEFPFRAIVRDSTDFQPYHYTIGEPGCLPDWDSCATDEDMDNPQSVREVLESVKYDIDVYDDDIDIMDLRERLANYGAISVLTSTGQVLTIEPVEL